MRIGRVEPHGEPRMLCVSLGPSTLTTRGNASKIIMAACYLWRSDSQKGLGSQRARVDDAPMARDTGRPVHRRSLPPCG